MATTQLVNTMICKKDGQDLKINYISQEGQDFKIDFGNLGESTKISRFFPISSASLQSLVRARGKQEGIPTVLEIPPAEDKPREDSGVKFITIPQQYITGQEEMQIGDKDENAAVKGDEEKGLGVCKVCGDAASGKYFGALVCVPCKTFFLRYAGDSFQFVCKRGKSCEINISSRIQCKYCRYKKCIEAGMYRKVRPTHIEPKEGRQLCVVCSDLGNGIHFGAMTCEGCKKFFRRALNEHRTYLCKYEQKCRINPQTRNLCRYCRYIKCRQSGMSREAIQMGRPSKINQILLHHFPHLQQQQQQPDQRIVSKNCIKTQSHSDLYDRVRLGEEKTSSNEDSTPTVIYAQPDSTTTLVKREHSPTLNSPEPPSFFLPRNMFAEHASWMPAHKINGICSSPSITSSDEIPKSEKGDADKSFEIHSNQENEIEVTMRQSLDISVQYWGACLPDENLLFSDQRHWEFINNIFPNYDKFVQTSDKINSCLRQEFELWRIDKEKNGIVSLDKRSDWIKIKVIPAYTVVSVTYCKKIPGFSSFNQADQIKMIRLGQSPSRILVAALHWFHDETKDFKYFLYWREHDRFKDSIISFSKKIRSLQLDPIEAALLNALLIVATDYPDLADAVTKKKKVPTATLR